MCKKTVLKLLLSKWGLLSLQMQKAIEYDQAIVKEDGTIDYDDNKPDKHIPIDTIEIGEGSQKDDIK